MCADAVYIVVRGLWFASLPLPPPLLPSTSATMTTKDTLLQWISSSNTIILSTLERSSHTEIIEQLQQFQQQLLQMKSTLEAINEHDLTEETRAQVSPSSPPAPSSDPLEVVNS